MLVQAGSESQPEADLIHDRAMGDVVYSDFNGCLHNAGNADATDAEDDVVDTDATDEALDADDADDSAEGPATPGHAEDDFEVQFECFHPNDYDATEEGSGTDYLEFGKLNSATGRARCSFRADRTTENTLPYRLYDSLPSEYAHLHLSASPFHPVPLVPIFCVADEHNIVPLMGSAIAQRAALGLELPVIGIMYPTVGSTFSVLVAWRDISTCAVGEVRFHARVLRLISMVSLGFVSSSLRRGTRQAMECLIWNVQRPSPRSPSSCASRRLTPLLISSSLPSHAAHLSLANVAAGVLTIIQITSLNIRGEPTSLCGTAMYTKGQCCSLTCPSIDVDCGWLSTVQVHMIGRKSRDRKLSIECEHLADMRVFYSALF